MKTNLVCGLPTALDDSYQGRRAFLRGLGALGFGALAMPTQGPLWAKPAAGPGILFPLSRGPYQNNGASPWYYGAQLGTPGQPLKLALDSGTNFIWVTSTLCGDGCQHYSDGYFSYDNSTTFTWVDQTPVDVSFGPWGTMVVERGEDVIKVPSGSAQCTTMLLAKSYAGSQFFQLDWDGGIGMPSGSDYVEPGISFFFADLMNSGAIDPAFPYISFDTDYTTKLGSCQIGGFDANRFDFTTGIRMPWSPYLQYPGMEYLWTTQLKGYMAGSYNFNISPSTKFCLDSGSSQFKGDNNIMSQTFDIVTSKQPGALVTLFVGEAPGGGTGQIIIPPQVYNVKIEAGPDAGKTIAQFQPLNLSDLVLVGSVLMDLFYTVLEYDVNGTAPNYHLSPTAMWLFQKRSGPQGMIKPGKTAARLGAKKVGPPREFRNQKARSMRA